MSWLVLHWLYMYVLRQIKIMLCYVMYWFSRPFVFVCAIVCLGDRSSVRYHSFVWSFDFLIVRLCYRSIFYRWFVWSFVFLWFVCAIMVVYVIVRFCSRSFVYEIVRLFIRLTIVCVITRVCDLVRICDLLYDIIRLYDRSMF